MIRLQRVGRKHEPVFRLVLTDSQNGPKSGRFLEILGSYDTRKEGGVDFKNDKIKHWISKGAQLSNTVHNLLIERKVIEGKKINALPKKTPTISEKAEEKVAPAPAEANVEAPIEAPTEEVSAPAEAPTEAPAPVAEETTV
ncbi:30S ribosomal protein S16 [Candidatus Woesearchaeota archaeon]|nr:30S ribosomal protein S16 [Candidatus Woesearchaeota archaeon]